MLRNVLIRRVESGGHTVTLGFHNGQLRFVHYHSHPGMSTKVGALLFGQCPSACLCTEVARALHDRSFASVSYVIMRAHAVRAEVDGYGLDKWVQRILDKRHERRTRKYQEM